MVIKVWRLLDTNCRPGVRDATALPTEPQPLPYISTFCFQLMIWYRIFKQIPMWTSSDP